MRIPEVADVADHTAGVRGVVPRRRSRVLVAVWLVATLAVVGVAGWYVGLWPGHRFTVADLLGGDWMAARVEVTEQRCVSVGCLEAWETERGTFMSFDSDGEAEHWATILGDEGRRWKNLVLDMHDVQLTFEQRREAIETLFSRHDWS